jgi:hypothetical protein
MKDKDKILIERYLEGALDKQERIDFESRLEKDKQLRTELEEIRQIQELWGDAGEYEKTREMVSQILVQERNSSGSFNSRIIYIAASIVLLIGISFFAYQKLKTPSPATNLMASHDTVQQQEKTFELKKMTPASYSKADYVIRLIAPDTKTNVKEGRTLEFRWETVKKGEDSLFIKKVGSDKSIYSKVVDLQKKSANIDLRLKPGEYFWYLGSQNNSLIFKVVK